MSRDQNHLHREIDEYHADRQAMAEWIVEAHEIHPWRRFTEQEWLVHGHEPPDAWLVTNRIIERSTT